VGARASAGSTTVAAENGSPAYLVAALRSLLFYAVYGVSVCLHSVLMLLVSPFVDYPRRYSLLISWNRFVVQWARIACGIRYEVQGLENLPSGGCVVVANHQSSWETIFLATLFPQVCILLKRELLSIPFFGWALRLLRPIAIDRDNPRAALKQLVEQGAARLGQGNSVLVFPEGTRVESGQSIRFTRGAAQLAIRAGANILCVAHDAGKCWPGRRLIKFPGTIRVAISPPLSSADREAAALTREAQAWIEARLTEFAAAA
jgi:1-acyl-sn-glycerol-3-phosphate acyltransferase